MIRGIYLRERKATRVKRRFKLIIILTIIVLIYKVLDSTFSLFESEAASAADMDIAFYALTDSYETTTIDVADLQPYDASSSTNNNKVEYYFTVSNFMDVEDKDDDGNVKEDSDGNAIMVRRSAETDIEYKLTIRSTTNIPLEFELYKNQESLGGTNVATNDIKQDKCDTYFDQIFQDEYTFEKGKEKLFTYKLVITYPEDEMYKDSKYQDLIECIEIAIDSHQVAETTTTTP